MTEYNETCEFCGSPARKIEGSPPYLGDSEFGTMYGHPPSCYVCDDCINDMANSRRRERNPAWEHNCQYEPLWGSTTVKGCRCGSIMIDGDLTISGKDITIGSGSTWTIAEK